MNWICLKIEVAVLVTAELKIQWLSDEYDCDDCGCSYAEGARVFLNEVSVLELLPVAHCFGGKSWTESEVYKQILEKLGITVEETYGNCG